MKLILSFSLLISAGTSLASSYDCSVLRRESMDGDIYKKENFTLTPNKFIVAANAWITLIPLSGVGKGLAQFTVKSALPPRLRLPIPENEIESDYNATFGFSTVSLDSKFIGVGFQAANEFLNVTCQMK